MNMASDTQIASNDLVRSAGGNLSIGARASLVNRTHRVVRERAKAMQQRRSRGRSLLLPLLVCSALVLLSALAVWTGLYQYSTAEAVQADLAVASVGESNNHVIVILLWFVPVSLAVLTTVWVRRSRGTYDDERR